MAESSLFARRVRALRERRGWSQYELARRSGVSRTTITNLEAGIRPSTSLENAAKIAEALGTSLDLLVRGDILDSESEPEPEPSMA